MASMSGGRAHRLTGRRTTRQQIPWRLSMLTIIPALGQSCGMMSLLPVTAQKDALHSYLDTPKVAISQDQECSLWIRAKTCRTSCADVVRQPQNLDTYARQEECSVVTSSLSTIMQDECFPPWHQSYFKFDLAVGVLGLSGFGGFWLSHSVPKYPDSPNDSPFTGIHTSQILNGQSFACLSLDPEGLETMSSLLQTANVDIFTPLSLPEGLRTQYAFATQRRHYKHRTV